MAKTAEKPYPLGLIYLIYSPYKGVPCWKISIPMCTPKKVNVNSNAGVGSI